MNDSKALLSQKEIDALVEFLKTKDQVGKDVLDQASIDRLVRILNEAKTTGEKAAGEERFFGNSVLSVEKDITEQKEQCRLLYEKDERNYAHIVCENIVTGMRYEITPECLNQSRIAEGEEESWGFAVMPALFDYVAMRLQVKYTAEVFAKVCSSYAMILYGDEDAKLPNAYLPTADRLLDGIGEK